jgi:hypothetical protein
VTIILKLTDYFTGPTYGPRRLVSPAVWRMPEPCIWRMWATITFWRLNPQCLKGNDWTEGQCHVAQTGLHKSHQRLSDSALTDLNLLPSLLSPQKYLHVQPPNRCFAATNVSFTKHCTWNKTRGASRVQCNCVMEAFDSNKHQSWLEVQCTIFTCICRNYVALLSFSTDLHNVHVQISTGFSRIVCM